jgi:hypothetical protein
MSNAKEIGVNASFRWRSIPSRASPVKLQSGSGRPSDSGLPFVSRHTDQIDSKQVLGRVDKS